MIDLRLKEIGISRENFVEAVECGFSACTYWANLPKFKEGMTDLERLESGEIYTILDIEDPNIVYHLKIEDFTNALIILKKEYPEKFKDIQCGQFDTITGDMLIQLAVCGEIIYS